jgi:hypothetical protein
MNKKTQRRQAEALRSARRPILEINAPSTPECGSEVPAHKIQNDGIDGQGEGPKDHAYRFDTDNPFAQP